MVNKFDTNTFAIIFTSIFGTVMGMGLIFFGIVSSNLFALFLGIFTLMVGIMSFIKLFSEV